MPTVMSGKAARIVALSWPVAALLVSMAGGGAPASAFALSERLTNGTIFPSDDLEDAVRWTNQPGSLAEDGQRGLGGGVEYALAADFCEKLLPAFIDEPKPDCATVRELLDDAFRQWGEGSPHLSFTDVTGKIEPEVPPPDARDPARGYGAEVDVLAAAPPGFLHPGPFGAEAVIYFLPAPPVGGDGRPLLGNTLTSADIFVNPAKCFYISSAMARSTCNHFPSLMLHVIGRALGLGSPDQNPKRNWDNDSQPDNAVVINCEDPTRGLRLSRRIDPEAAMISGQGLAQRVLPGLRNDDIGGRDFLYPSCGG